MRRRCLSSFNPGKETAIDSEPQITLITEGSAAIGFGHLRRSVTLAGELQKQVPVQLWILRNPENTAITPDVERHLGGLDWHAGPVPNLPPHSVRIVDLEGDHQRAVLKSYRLDVHTLALDWFDQVILPDMTINLIDHGGKMRATYAAAGCAEDYREGPDYAIIRPGLLALRPSEAPVAAKHVRRVLITPGGADPARRSLEALRSLEANVPPDTQIVLIIGPLVPEAYESELRAAAGPNVILLRNPPDFDQQLAAADVVLCSGGGTLLESLAMGKPTVVFPQTPAEHTHAQSHVEAGACVLAERLPQVLSDETLRQSLVATAYRRVDGKGTRRIAEAAVELLHRP